MFNISSKNAYLKFFIIIIAGIIMLACLSLFTLFTGEININFNKLFNFGSVNTEYLILYKIRLPRILMAILVGGSCALTGSVYQTILKNPLAEPYILGLSSGAALGSAIASIYFPQFYLVPLFAFLGVFVSVCIVFLCSYNRNYLSDKNMILSGVIVGSFFNSIIIFLLTFSNSQELQKVFFWMLGSLGNVTLNESLMLLIPFIILNILILFLAKKLNIIHLGDETAISMGVNPFKLKLLLLLLTTGLIALSVAFCGPIGFVGLIIPHAARFLFGYNHFYILPTSFLIGSLFLLISDTIARTVLAPTQLPIGVVTAFFGAPIFLFILLKWSRIGK
ncbi:MAG: iron ABC transporter permease [Pseudomonadota bacterium]